MSNDHLALLRRPMGVAWLERIPSEKKKPLVHVRHTAVWKSKPHSHLSDLGSSIGGLQSRLFEQLAQGGRLKRLSWLNPASWGRPKPRAGYRAGAIVELKKQDPVPLIQNDPT